MSTTLDTDMDGLCMMVLCIGIIVHSTALALRGFLLVCSSALRFSPPFSARIHSVVTLGVLLSVVRKTCLWLWAESMWMFYP